MEICYKETSYPYLILSEVALDEENEKFEEASEELSDFLIGYKFNKLKKNILIYPTESRGGEVQVNVGDYLVILEDGVNAFSEAEFEDLFYTKNED